MQTKTVKGKFKLWKCLLENCNLLIYIDKKGVRLDKHEISAAYFIKILSCMVLDIISKGISNYPFILHLLYEKI